VTQAGVYVEDVPAGPRTIVGVATSTAAFVGRTAKGRYNKPVDITSFAQFERSFGGLWAESNLGYAVRDFFRTGGTTAVVVRVRGSDAAAHLAGVHALDACELINLIVVPPYTPAAGLGERELDRRLIADIVAYAESRNAMAIFDAPNWASVGAATAELAGAAFSPSANAAVYFPRIQQPDPLASGTVSVFPCAGAVAGVIARTDASRGVWRPPAGLDAVLTGVSDLAIRMTDADNGQLSALGVNTLRTTPGGECVVWGARTCAAVEGLASEWKYVPVRRTALFIEQSLSQGLQWAVFEPNNEPIWTEVRGVVGVFLHALFREGAFQGATPAECYYVKCGRDTMTQSDIDAGVLNIIVGIAPSRPAEFVTIRLALRAEAR
jgi:phage tail sheath protein FI